MISYAPSVKKLSGLPDSTGYFAIASILLLPFASGLPMISGKFLDHFAHWEGDSYRIMFAAYAGLIVISLISILKTDFNAHSSAKKVDLSKINK